MGWFGPKRVPCPGGKWTTILATSFAQIPKSWCVRFEGEVAGEAEIRKTAWIFPVAPVRIPLSAKMTFERGYWNTFYKVLVFPAADVVAVID